MNKFLKMLAAAALVSSVTVTNANANAVGVFTVNSKVHGENTAYSTLQVDAGNTLTISSTGNWTVDNIVPTYPYTSAEGSSAIQLGNGFNLGALLGRIGSGPVFYVGTYFNQMVSTSGILKLWINDDPSDLADNDGSVTANVSAVPLPAALPLLLSGLGMIGLARRRKLTAV